MKGACSKDPDLPYISCPDLLSMFVFHTRSF